MSTNYQLKYFKYKAKYLKQKNYQKGGKDQRSEEIEKDIEKLLEEMTSSEGTEKPEKQNFDKTLKNLLDELKKELLKTFKEVNCCGNNINDALARDKLNDNQKKFLENVNSSFSKIKTNILNIAQKFNTNIDNMVTKDDFDNYFLNNYKPYIETIIINYSNGMSQIVKDLKASSVAYYILKHSRDKCDLKDKDCCDHTIIENCLLQLANQSLVRIMMLLGELKKNVPNSTNVINMFNLYQEKLVGINDFKGELDKLNTQIVEVEAKLTHALQSVGQKAAPTSEEKKKSRGFFGLFKKKEEPVLPQPSQKVVVDIHKAFVI